jgi:hypothetical protein
MNIKTFICPSDPTNVGNGGNAVGQASYGLNAQVFKANWEGGYNRYPASITDGTSNTIFFTEKYAACNGYWPNWGASLSSPYGGSYFPQAIGPAALFQVRIPNPSQNCVTYLTSSTPSSYTGIATSGHTSGINVALGDGSVRFVTVGVSGITWWSAMTPAGGEVLGTRLVRSGIQSSAKRPFAFRAGE